MKTVCHQQTHTKRNTKGRRKKIQEGKLKDKISNKKGKYVH